MREIPKVIHYCWFGRNPLSEMEKRCIESWKKYFPEYEIKEWNEDNFDVHRIAYTKEAYERKKYAFVSDYARFWILYHYGGVYFDTDVEVLRSFEPILKHGAYMGCERDAEAGHKSDGEMRQGAGITVAPGLGMAAVPRMEIIQTILKSYEAIHFVKENGEVDTDTVVAKTTRILLQAGLKNKPGVQEVAGVTIYPQIYFCPDEKARMNGTYDSKTFSAHHYSASWRDRDFNRRLKKPVWKKFFIVCGKAGKLAGKVLGEKRWSKIRDRYFKRMYNFVRGVRE